MSNFWDNNKGSIMSGLASAGKYGYQGTKYVAKAGYKASKTHYNNSQGKKNVEESSDEGYMSESASDLSHLQDPKMFPPPPLKPGQKQISSDGTVIDAGNAPLVQAGAVPMANVASHPGLPPRTPTANSIPMLTQQQTYPPQNMYQQQPPPQPPLQQQVPPQVQQIPQPGQQLSQQPMQQLHPEPIPPRNYQAAVETPPQYTPIPSLNAQHVQEQLQQQLQQQFQPSMGTPDQNQALVEGYPLESQQQLQPQTSQYQSQQVPSPQIQNQGQPMQQQQNYFQPQLQQTQSQQYIDSHSQYQQQGQQQVQPPVQQLQPQVQQQPIQQPPPQAQPQYHQSYLPQYQQQTQPLQPQYQQPVQPPVVQSPIPQQHYYQQQQQTPYQPASQPQMYQEQPGQQKPIVSPAPALAQRPNLSDIQTSAGHGASQEAMVSSTSSITVKPYVWMDSDERKEKKKIELQPVSTIDIHQVTPPLHKDRSSSSSLKSSSRDASVLEKGKSLSPGPAPLPSRNVRPPTSVDHTKPNNVTPAAATGTSAEVSDDQVRPNESITGVYHESTVSFPPPPKPTHNGLPISPSVSHARPTVSHKPPNPPRPPLSSKPTLPPIQTHQRITSTQRAPIGRPKEEVHQAAVLGAYNYNVDVGFAPPPKPPRSMVPSPANDHQTSLSSRRPSQEYGGVANASSRTLPPPPPGQQNDSLHQHAEEEPASNSSESAPPAMRMLPLGDLPPPPQRNDSHTTTSEQPAVPSRTFDPPPRYSTNETIPPTYNIDEDTQTAHKKPPPKVPKKKVSLRAGNKPPVPKKKASLSESARTSLPQEADSSIDDDDDDDNSGEGNSFRKYLRHVVPAERNHIHKSK
ncbi:Aim3 [Kluyveromyces lactis]|nr:Aim3 [Kluyveromyces lactis]